MFVKKHTWSSIYKIIQNLRPELAQIINNINPPKNYFLYEIEYEYGASILDKGIFLMPNNNNILVPLTDSSISNSIKEDLSYSGTCPMGIISKNSIETNLVFNSKRIPASLYKEGEIVSLWRVLEGKDGYHIGSHWNITSGARSICVLPKITDKTGFHSLKIKYGLKIESPYTLTNQWEIFKYLVNHEKFPEKWTSKVLFFSKNWFNHKNDNNWERCRLGRAQRSPTICMIGRAEHCEAH